jgi:hypothetical protein
MIAYHIDSHRRIVVTRVSGKLTFADLAGHLHQLIRDPKFSADFNALIVACDETAVPAAGTVSALAPMVRAWSKRRAGAKWAFVLPSATAKTFAESALHEIRLSSITSRCFLSETAAQAWLVPAPPLPSDNGRPLSSAVI